MLLGVLSNYDTKTPIHDMCNAFITIIGRPINEIIVLPYWQLSWQLLNKIRTTSHQNYNNKKMVCTFYELAKLRSKPDSSSGCNVDILSV